MFAFKDVLYVLLSVLKIDLKPRYEKSDEMYSSYADIIKTNTAQSS